MAVWIGDGTTKKKAIPFNSSLVVNVNDPRTRRDLHHYIGRWCAADDEYAKLALAAGTDTAGGLGAWANPEGVNILVTNVYLDVTTASTGACTVSAGVAANATTLNATLLSGKNVNTVATYSSAGVIQKMTPSQFVTFSTASGASAGLVANAYITYMLA